MGNHNLKNRDLAGWFYTIQIQKRDNKLNILDFDKNVVINNIFELHFFAIKKIICEVKLELFPSSSLVV